MWSRDGTVLCWWLMMILMCMRTSVAGSACNLYYLWVCSSLIFFCCCCNEESSSFHSLMCRGHAYYTTQVGFVFVFIKGHQSIYCMECRLVCVRCVWYEPKRCCLKYLKQKFTVQFFSSLVCFVRLVDSFVLFCSGDGLISN